MVGVRGEEGKEEGGEGKRERRKKAGGGKESEEGRREMKVGFWNVAGLKSKDEDVWKELQSWDVVGLTEMWVEEKDWEKVRGRLPKGYRWSRQNAKRNKEKGRGIGGMVTGAKAEIEEVEWEREQEIEGIMERRVRWGGETWRIITVYVNKDLEEKIEKLKERTEARGRVKNILYRGGGLRQEQGRKGR